ncbi:hypothetical protein COL5a_006443 [Colletotrichum fioriniae]|nr:uncharacterized protein COL516b_003287 [Colletotrichum fioriniae]KAJ0308739.1 hypothetical protein COL516b_003287 [Colletotrichum fioriniae]KAJ0326891.1 hypothetical protein COL5a_006443 [Colletotrichum fioriniae]
MRFSATAILAAAAATSASAQSVVGTAYGFAKGVTGGGNAAAAIPSSVDELTQWLADDTPRTIIIDKEYDFTGTSAKGKGCSRKSCTVANGGQLFLGDLSCGTSDNVATTVSYDLAATEPLIVGSNKSILGSKGKGILNGKGLRVKTNAKNVIIQGIEITNLNPSVVWGGDAIDLQGGNDGVWIDHNRISKIGRQFIVTHFAGSRVTISNNYFDGATPASTTCNGNHYWTEMHLGDGDQITIDRNYYVNVSGRSPKLGPKGTFHATNNFFQNVQGHTFELFTTTLALIEGNAFENVKQPYVGQVFSNSFNAPDAKSAAACSSKIGRACVINSVDSKSGQFKALAQTNVLSTFAKLSGYLVKPVAADTVASLVVGNAGPAKLGGSGSGATPTTVATSTRKATSVIAATQSAKVTVKAPSTHTPKVTPTAVATPSSGANHTSKAPPSHTSKAAHSSKAAQSSKTKAAHTSKAKPTPSTPSTHTSTKRASCQQTAAGNSTESAIVQNYHQCGGKGWTGATVCVAGTSCVVQNEWYSQCVSSATRRSSKALRRI